MLAALARTRPRSKAGERFRCSNFGAGLLGLALAHAAGSDYATLVRERITAPLSLRDTVIELDDDRRRRLAAGTKWRGGRAASTTGSRSSRDGRWPTGFRHKRARTSSRPRHRLYRAIASEQFVLDPHDRRVPVTLP